MYRKYYLRYKRSMTHAFALNWLSLSTVLSSKCKSSLWQQQHLQKNWVIQKIRFTEFKMPEGYTKEATETKGGAKGENKTKQKQLLIISSIYMSVLIDKTY